MTVPHEPVADMRAAFQQRRDLMWERLNAIPRAAYWHVHYAAPGCYAARVERAD